MTGVQTCALPISLWTFIRELNQSGHTILLTTHYLEEAQQLCSRIAMLKQGKVIALDTTEHLLAAFSERVLRVKLEGLRMTDALAKREVKQDGTWHNFAIHDYQEVEDVLAELRQTGAVIAQMEVTEPELEDVFVKLMRTH